MTNLEFLDKSGLKLLVDKFNEKLETNAKNDAAIADAVLNCFNKVEYKSEDKKIYFYNDEKELGFVDTTDFVKDGMIDNVEVKNGKMVITFNTEAGHENIELDITSIFDADNYYTTNEIDTELAKKQDVGNYVEYNEFNGHKIIYLNEDEQIGGLPKVGSGINMLQLRKYGSVEYPTVELGSTSAALTLNANGGKVAIDGGEKQEIVATISDVEKANEDVVRYTLFENRKTIVLAEGDTISSLGINLGMVKTYEGLQYGENCNPEFTGKMPVLEVGGTKGALVLNSCEDVVKVEVWDAVENKRKQHAIATVDDFKAIDASFIETLFAEPEVKE